MQMTTWLYSFQSLRIKGMDIFKEIILIPYRRGLRGLVRRTSSFRKIDLYKVEDAKRLEVWSYALTLS